MLISLSTRHLFWSFVWTVKTTAVKCWTRYSVGCKIGANEETSSYNINQERGFIQIIFYNMFLGQIKLLRSWFLIKSCSISLQIIFLFYQFTAYFMANIAAVLWTEDTERTLDWQREEKKELGERGQLPPFLPAQHSPVIEQSRRRVGVSPEYWLIIPLPAATGTGIVRVIGLWNFRLIARK